MRLSRMLVLTGGLFLLVCSGVARASFGIAPGSFSAMALNEDGSVDLRAGSHPFAYHVQFRFNENAEHTSADGSARDVIVELPPGFVGNPTAVPRCSRKDFDGGENANCPGDTQVGTFTSIIVEGGTVLGPHGPVYNLVPPAGAAASIGFNGESFTVIENASLSRGGPGGYRIKITSNIPHPHLLIAEETVWGMPASTAHDSERECFSETGTLIPPPCSTDAARLPFLTLPTACEPQLPTVLEADSIEDPGVFSSETAANPPLLDCESLAFKPSITVRPAFTVAESATGVHVDVKIPQEEAPNGTATAQLKSTTVALPAGMVVNPSSANGLESCSLEQVGLENTEPASCPSRSQIGTVHIVTPLLDHPLPGRVFLAAQGANPFDSLIAIYVVIEDPATGVIVKLAGHVVPDPQTGQLTTTFSETPQFPFEEFQFDLNGGPKASLMTPPVCGAATTQAEFLPWTSPFEQAVDTTDSFAVTGAPGGRACAPTLAAQPDTRSFNAGTTSTTAGEYGSFVLNLGREDGTQQIGALSVTLPPGLTGRLAGVQECSDAQIAAAMAPGRTGAEELAAPSCPAASELGTVDVAAGAGSLPVHVPGRLYLAGPYGGAPFSIVAITPAVAGPFDLGNVVVRSTLRVNPRTAQVTVDTGALPRILQGIPLDIRSIVVTVNRKAFMLNPTSCEKMVVTGSTISLTGAVANLSAPFQVGGCQGLPFKPSFTVSTSASTSKANGASLVTRVSFPKNPATGLSGQANIAKVRVELPKQLPSRLTTLQKACTERQFNTNPAGCPPESVVGHAVAHTPILPVPLEGPAYFVSHGNAAFPELVMVLQGDGVTIQLNGETDIKHGITSSTFNQIPDAPVESFVLTLPEGPHSALSAPGGRLCEQSLVMPTRLTGQNGAQVTQKTRIEVQGCSSKLAITRHKITDKTAIVQVYVPAAGDVKVHGRGLSSKTRTVTSREVLTFSLTQKHAGRLNTRLTVVYTPKKGRPQFKSLTLGFKR